MDVTWGIAETPCSLISKALAQRGMLKTFSSSMDHAICQWPSSTANVRCCGDLVEDSVSGFDVFVFFFTGGSGAVWSGVVVSMSIQQSEDLIER